MATANDQHLVSTDRYSADKPSSIIASYFDSPIAFVLVGLLLLIIITRANSSRNVTSSPTDSKDGEAKTIPLVPYWLPFLGHIPMMAYDADGFIRSLSNRFTEGIFSLNFGGTTHHIMTTPGLATALLNQKTSVATSEDVGRRLIRVVFGLPKDELSKYDAAFSGLLACYKHIMDESALGEIVTQTARKTNACIKDFVTFSHSVVDEMVWERNSTVTIKTDMRGEEVVEASLLPLTRDFAAHIAIPTFMGSDFLANFPDFSNDIWKLDQGFPLLATGLPRLLPIPTLTRAHIARRRMLDRISEFHAAMEKRADGKDPGPDWRNLDDVSGLVKARVVVYREVAFSIQARAAIELSLLWAGNANSDMLVFWMLNRIYADKALLEMIREEMAPYARAFQPRSELPISEPPRLETFDVEGLCTSCPLLKSCYIECLRVDTASWSFKEVKQDFVLQSRDKNAQGWLMRKGEYAHAAHNNIDPNYFDHPLVWKADRHVKAEGDEKRADMGILRPYGGGVSMCKGRAFAFKECMMLVASVIALWDIEPAGGGAWKMPRHKKATGVYTTNDDTRVWIKRRQLGQAREVAAAGVSRNTIV